MKNSNDKQINSTILYSRHKVSGNIKFVATCNLIVQVYMLFVYII